MNETSGAPKITRAERRRISRVATIELWCRFWLETGGKGRAWDRQRTTIEITAEASGIGSREFERIEAFILGTPAAIERKPKAKAVRKRL